ncbi:TetR/AcrR family transcriptional regulator [Ensifer sp.]|jgi:AcrR family transcriptional regulator|uniref:TetR/AcrR family transcriptional regulator n=1 Tax=Ensifer sp. TaxID=1872086 RepID=UPI002E0DC1FC|nr:TetR/AcrR family transcriptional regulator [Ensifer sp.]
MPKISDEKRAARRAQILEAAWTCFQKDGLHATTMDHIIRASGLSAGAVYSYYPSKDDLILAAVATSLSGLSAIVAPLLHAEPPMSPSQLVGEITEAIDRFASRDGFDLKRIALLGWSEAQRNEQLRATMKSFYIDFRCDLAGALKRWRDDRTGVEYDVEADMAAALLSLVLGYVVQSAVIGDVSPQGMVDGLAQLERAAVE